MLLQVQLETDFYVTAFDKCRFVYKMLKRPNSMTPTAFHVKFKNLRQQIIPLLYAAWMVGMVDLQWFYNMVYF